MSLKAQDGAGVVIYQGGGSKLGLPGLRVGWLVAPIPAMAALTIAKTFEDLHTAALTQRLAAAFIGSPHVERHLARLRIECRVRRDALVGALRQHCPRLRFRVPAGSYYLWATLPAPPGRYASRHDGSGRACTTARRLVARVSAT